jgi:DNA-directed RNA polymerase specialized sigma24 family protein
MDVDVEALVALVRSAGDDNPIEGLAAAARARQELERLEAVQVRAARMRGLSWAEIATLLGVSRQAVHKKYRACLVGWRT